MTVATKALNFQNFAIYALAGLMVVLGSATALWGALFTVLIGPFSLVISAPALLIAYLGPNLIKTLDIEPHANPVGRFFVELLASLSFSIIAFVSFNMVDSFTSQVFTPILMPLWVIPTLFFIISLIRTFRTARKCKGQS